MWIIICKSQSRTYSSNYFVLLWSEEVAFYLKCFQKWLLNSGVPHSILTRFCTFRATGRVFLRFVFYQPSNSVSTSQPIFVRVAILVWFTVLTGKEGHRGGGRVCSKATCSEVVRIFTRCLWESLPAQPKHSVSQFTEVRLSGKANSLHLPTFRAPCLQRNWSRSPSLVFVISLCGLGRADTSMKLN